jgi:hypothetical protein
VTRGDFVAGLAHLGVITELGLVRKQGSGRSAYYETVRR